MPTLDTIGKRISWARRKVAAAHGLKVWGQGKLAQACGWDKNKRQRISMYEKDQREPSVDDIRKLANALNVHPSWLAFGENIAGEISVEERAVLIAFRGLEDQHKHVFVQLLRGPEVVPAYRGKERRKGERPRRRDPTVIQKLPLKLPFRD